MTIDYLKEKYPSCPEPTLAEVEAMSGMFPYTQVREAYDMVLLRSLCAEYEALLHETIEDYDLDHGREVILALDYANLLNRLIKARTEITEAVMREKLGEIARAVP